MARLLRTAAIATLSFTGLSLGQAEEPSNPTPTFKQYCFGCHGKAASMGGINLEQLTTQPSVGEQYEKWQRVVAAVEQKRMPPPKMRQPTDIERANATTWIRTRLDDYIAKHAGDPGKITVRRLTSGEYAYTVRDLTGLDLKFDGEFASDSVGGEGFTNYGDVQFMADANLERYLEAAKKIADHAVIGSGPLQFFDDPGKSGFELSAIKRINDIYAKYGIRSNSGEGGKPYGLDRYTQAFYVCWQFKNRAALGEPNSTLDQLATRDGVSVRFAQHLWSVMNHQNATYPTSMVIEKFNALPAATSDRTKSLSAAKVASETVMRATVDWPRWLLAAGAYAEGGQGDERALILNNDVLTPKLSHKFTYLLRGKGKPTANVYISVVSANGAAKDTGAILWRNPQIRVRGKDRGAGTATPLRAQLDDATLTRLGFGKGLSGEEIDANSFVSRGPVTFEVKLPEGAFGAALSVDAELAPGVTGDSIFRCVISDSEDVMKGIPAWALLGDPNNPGVQAWKKNVLDFAANLPQNTQGEAAPSDKDPIPLPFNTALNQPERDFYHTKIKYYRRDAFLFEHVLDDENRIKLNQAWNDLLASFEYHNTLLRFTANKYKLDIKKDISTITPADIAALPVEPRKFIEAFKTEFDAVQNAQRAARPRHIDDAIAFAAKAWRRPLTAAEKDRLRAFYVKSTEIDKLDHGRAIEAVLARVLVSPAFLYRLEQPSQTAETKALTNAELASRLSYFLWSSIPDAELTRAANAGELSKPEGLDAQVKRMLADPKARRMATEFFGQWLGFYRFDQHRGVDTKRFPEFTDEVKSAMYDEAISFFEYIVRKDRPVGEMLTADYTFLNQPLAKHYGVKAGVKSTGATELFTGADKFNRGGMLRLGAVLTATSAPLRTSPVKRGDWVLRRVLGTPTPPPPADAGSIPADDKMFGGMTVKQRLEVHKRNATCASCHTRIDPLGFPLERFDSVGRFRDNYPDGKPIEDFSALADDTKIAGVNGLLDYLKKQESQVLKTMSHKLVGYALGRTVLASDQPLIDQMVKAGSNAPFSQVISDIVTSKQFRYRREVPELSRSQPVHTASAKPAVTANPVVTSAPKSTPKDGGE